MPAVTEVVGYDPGRDLGRAKSNSPVGRVGHVGMRSG